MPAPFWMIGTGAESEPLSEDLQAFISEIRVEEDLSKPTRYAIRFEENICEGDFTVSRSPALRFGETLAVIVKEKPEDQRLVCLVRGPITKVKTSAVTVGEGTFYEVHGEDERVLLAREGVQLEEQGYASDVLDGLLSFADLPDTLEIDVEETTIEYDEDFKLTHNGSLLEFAEKTARDNIKEFWIEYDPVEDGMPVAGHVRVKSSPGLPETSGPAPFPPPIPLLSAESGKSLLVSAASGDCPGANVLSFDLDIEVEHASRVFFNILDDNGEIVAQEVTDEQPPLDDSGQRLDEAGGAQRSEARRVQGNPLEEALRAQAEAIEAGWYVKASASTALFTLKFLPRPHQVVSVEGIGEQYTGAFQIYEAIHVLNGAGVLSDIKLRRNSLNIVEAPISLPGGINA
nr:hypothetical protein [uncultured bacterium]